MYPGVCFSRILWQAQIIYWWALCGLNSFAIYFCEMIKTVQSLNSRCSFMIFSVFPKNGFSVSLVALHFECIPLFLYENLLEIEILKSYYASYPLILNFASPLSSLSSFSLYSIPRKHSGKHRKIYSVCFVRSSAYLIFR